MDEREFYETYCKFCGTQRCEGPGSEWFGGCKHKEDLDCQYQPEEWDYDAGSYF